MTQDEMIELLMEDSKKIDELIQDANEKEMLAKLEQRLKEQEQEKKIEKEVKRIIDQWNI